MWQRDWNKPLYTKIIGHIRQRVMAGELKAGDKLPSTLDMAAEYGVCHKTVQSAMKSLVREGLLLRRMHYGTFVAESDRWLSSEEPVVPRVALLIRYLKQGTAAELFDGEIVDGVMEAAASAGCRIDLNMYSDLDTLSMDRFLQGFLLVRPDRQDALRIKRLGLPVALLDIAHFRSGLGFVRSNNAWGIQAAVRHLVRLGHRRVLYLHSDCSNPDNYSGIERQKAFLAATAGYGLPCDGLLIPAVEFERENGPLSASAVLTDGFHSTLTTVRALNRRGISFPQDVSLIGYDDPPLSEILPAPLTVVRQRLSEVGRTGLGLVLGREEEWRKAALMIKPELIVRGSTGRAK